MNEDEDEDESGDRHAREVGVERQWIVATVLSGREVIRADGASSGPSDTGA
ncbi:hypothetical protein [Haloterrigena salinisoli]|uniref:hypothetical protein n=1 Tax=Haloterrigena salinisoli TaxID=3132747 RepID=UPI0030CF4F2E